MSDAAFETFRASMVHELANAAPEVQRFLKVVATATFPNEVQTILFQIESNPLQLLYAITMFLVDEDGNDVDVSEHPELPPELANGDVLEIQVDVPETVRTALIGAPRGVPNIDEDGGRIMLEWLKGQIHGVMGSRLPVPMTIRIFDDDHAFDLVTDSWVEYLGLPTGSWR